MSDFATEVKKTPPDVIIVGDGNPGFTVDLSEQIKALEEALAKKKPDKAPNWKDGGTK